MSTPDRNALSRAGTHALRRNPRCVGFAGFPWQGRPLQSAEKLISTVILRSSGDEESPYGLENSNAGSFAEFTLSEVNGLRMTS